jgi:hypothetical protein
MCADSLSKERFVPEESLRKRGKSRKKPKRRAMTGAGRREQFSHPALKELEPCTVDLGDDAPNAPAADDASPSHHAQPITTVRPAFLPSPSPHSLVTAHAAHAHRTRCRRWD